MLTLEVLDSRLHGLASDVEEIRKEGRRGELASALFLALVLDRINLEEARRLALRGLESPSLDEAATVAAMVQELEVGRWATAAATGGA